MLLLPPPASIGPQAATLVQNALPSSHSKRAYQGAILQFLSWYAARGAPGLSKAVVQEFRSALETSGLAPSSISLKIAAIRKLATELADNGLLAPEAALSVAKVRGAKRLGMRTGNWLTVAQAERLLDLPDRTSRKGLRDRALLAVLLSAGLRRTEASGLQFDQIQQREGRWVILDLKGKHARVRTVPIPGWCKAVIDEWAAAAGICSGAILRPLARGGALAGEWLSAQSIFHIVRSYGKLLGVRLAPHDLRRSFARLAHRGRAALEQIQLSLGHASITTTEWYLGVRQDLADAPCDRLGLQIEFHKGEQS